MQPIAKVVYTKISLRPKTVPLFHHAKFRVEKKQAFFKKTGPVVYFGFYRLFFLKPAFINIISSSFLQLHFWLFKIIDIRLEPDYSL